MNLGVFIYREPNDGFQLLDKHLRNYPYVIPDRAEMRRLIQDSEGKAATHKIRRLQRMQSKTIINVSSGGITRALTSTAKD
jgi:hypothetical protein